MAADKPRAHGPAPELAAAPEGERALELLEPALSNPLELRPATERTSADIHVIREGVICRTDKRGQATPEGRGIRDLVVHASEGFIPLWAKDMTLRWRFNEASMAIFANPGAAKGVIEQLFVDGVLQWGDSAPIKFSMSNDTTDFELVMRATDDCEAGGCVLASAFFPDGGRHQLELYPKFFKQSPEERTATMAHEIGHIFGLRHFFANITENAWRSEIFGMHDPFTIMNYGVNSVMTDADRADLKQLYKLVWSGDLTSFNGTPIRQVKPYHTFGP